MTLQFLFEKQREFQSRFNMPINSQEFINAQVLALHEELSEAIRETNHKYWKTSYGQPLTPEQQKKFQQEIIDCWHFLINLSLAANLTSNDVIKMYKEKHNINIERNENGY